MALVPIGYVNTIYKFQPAIGANLMTTQIAWHLETDEVFTPAMLQRHADNFNLNVTPLLSDGILLVQVRSETGTAGDPRILEAAQTAGGAIAGGMAPPLECILVSKNSGEGGRKNRGRMYVPGVPEENVDGLGTLLTSYQEDLATAFTGFLEDVLADTETGVDDAVILHSILNTPTVIVSLSVESMIARQNRRYKR